MGPPTNVDGETTMQERLGFTDLASMGPPTNVDGEPALHHTPVTRYSRFNGAADKRRRRASRSPFSRRPISSFNGAADKRRRREPTEERRS